MVDTSSSRKRSALPYAACCCVALGPILLPSLFVVLYHFLFPSEFRASVSTRLQSSVTSFPEVKLQVVPESSLPSTHLRRLVSRDFFSPKVSPNLPNAPPSGICIAIPSAPRPTPNSWKYVNQLLTELDANRAKAPYFPREMRVVVYSSGCHVDLGQGAERAARVSEAFASDNPKDPHAGQSAMELYNALQKAEKESFHVGPHIKAIRELAGNLPLQIAVLAAHEAGCALLSNASRLLSEVPREWVGTDGWVRWRWRTQLAMDFIYVMHQCMATNPRFVLLLQDDVVPAKNFDLGIEEFLLNEMLDKPPWFLLSLYYPRSYRWKHRHGQEYPVPCCAQALFFNASEVRELLEFMEYNFMRLPMDHQVNRYIVMHRKKAYVHIPSLFQHVGSMRTNNFKTKFHRDHTFKPEGVKVPFVVGNKTVTELQQSNMTAISAVFDA